MNKTTIVRNLLYVLFFLVFNFSQDLKAQVVIHKPSLGFSMACADTGFFTYSVNVSFSGTFQPANQFVIVLSDPNGDFTNSTEIQIIDATFVTSTSVTLKFDLPTNTYGESYKLRVKSNSPELTSPSSNYFAAYYKIHNREIKINNNNPKGVFCAGGSYLLAIDPGAQSPLNFPRLSYRWYKELTPTTSQILTGEVGESLIVTQAGTYYVETNYGSCTSYSYSNRVILTESTTGSTAFITSSLGNPFCADSGPTTLTTISGTSHQWYLNDEIISGATFQTYDTDISGTYSVSVDIGGCIATASIDLVSIMITSSLNVDDVNTMNAGDTLDVEITTNAQNPEFLWYLNNNLIPSATTNTYQATEFGNYKIVINQMTGCLVSNELFFEITELPNPFPDVAKIPNVISPNNDGINDTWVLPAQYVSGTNTQIIIFNSYGKIVLNTSEYLNNWPLSDELVFTSVNPVYYYVITTKDNKTKKGSITIVNQK